MHFEREVGDYSEPVSAEVLREGGIYFRVGAFEREGAIPFFAPVVYIGRDLEARDEGVLHFQDAESYIRGVRYGSTADGAPTRFHQASVERPGVYEYEQAIDAFLMMTAWSKVRTP